MKNHPNIPNSRKTILSNGIKILTDKLTEMRSVSLGISVRAGSGDETSPEAGISHFIEHMMFKGTPTRSAFQIAKELDSVGGKINAATGKESTLYYCVLLDEHIDKGISVLTDIFLNSLFDPKEIELERGVILEEIRMYEDTPDELVHDLFAETILGEHPMGRSTIGSMETVKSFSRRNMTDYMGKIYTPENIIVGAAGNIEHEEIVKKIEPLFSSIKTANEIKRPSVPAIQKAIRIKPKKTEQVHICLGTKALSQLDEDRYPFLALDNILGGSMSSRLFQEVREKRGLAYSIYSYLNLFRDFGLFTVYAGTSMENHRKVIDITLQEFSKIKKDGITEEELKRAKEFIKGSLVLGLESTSSRMGWVMRNEFYYGKVYSVDEVFSKVDKITCDDIIRLAGKYFRDEYLALSMIGDFKDGKDGIKELKL